MKIMTLGILFAVALVTVSGCHWRHRRGSNYHERSYNSQPNADHLARGTHAGSVDA